MEKGLKSTTEESLEIEPEIEIKIEKVEAVTGEKAETKEEVKEEVKGEAEALPGLIKKCFACREQDIRSYSPLTLAYIGDCVYEIIVRTVVVGRKNKAVQKLYKDTAAVVKAASQCKVYDSLLEIVTEEEADILKRGRNAHFHTKAKNASVSEYKKATGLEALFGYLYLTGRMDRAVELLKLGLEKCDMEL